MILWTKEFETGSGELDRQHRLLIDHINLLEEQLHSTNPTREEVEFAIHLVEYLEAYATVHFQREDESMDRYRCSAHKANQREHERFRGFIHDYKGQCEREGFNVGLLRNLHEAMRSWIQTHILKIDVQLRPCIALSKRGGFGADPIA